MASTKTINFIPTVFRTDTTQKFLNATLDQLVTPPDLRKINAYVGRKFAPTFKSTDNYQPEPTTLRQNYQLEPSIVNRDAKTGELKFFSSYIDLLNQIDHNGGIVSNQDRLFANESYNFNGLFDFDKFVNFNQYYWLPNGPDAVTITGGTIALNQTFVVTRDPSSNSYQFSTNGSIQNPTLRLAHGGTYKFIINQPGFPFWIQSEPGVSGTKATQPSFSSRDVLGVTNNGTDNGVITLSVPQPTAQDFYVNMPLAATVNFGIDLHFSQIQGLKLSQLSALGGLDGMTSQLTVGQMLGKTLVFTNTDIDSSQWIDSVNNVTIPVSQRRNAWTINFVNPAAADPIINLQSAVSVSANQKIYITGGKTHAGQTYYLNPNFYIYTVIPNITAPLPTIFYQDGTAAAFVGAIDLVDSTYSNINIVTDIIGKPTYQSPNGVTFTNGLKVVFDTTAIPLSYTGISYYVEGVGSAINLVPVNNLLTPEDYVTANGGLVDPDYITVSRAAQDLNPWTRSNRWFHSDVISLTAQYNNTLPLFNQALRAARPIIEFEPNLQLFNFGVQAKAPIDIIDFTVTDARSTIELSQTYTLNGVVLKNGHRVVFAVDNDPTVRNQIYVVNIVTISAVNQINLVPAADYQILPGNNLVVMQGTHKGVEYFFDGTNWNQGQQKTSINQAPLFDIFDTSGVSLSNTTSYPASSFAGTKIFSYRIGTGVNDTVLGFPLSYRTLNQIGDIQFDNNFDSDLFTYTGQQTGDENINVGYLYQWTSLTSYNIRNNWTTITEPSKQFQVISGVYDGANPNFQFDIVPDTTVTVPYFRVYLNNSQIDTTQYKIVSQGTRNYVQITDASFTKGDRVDILIYSNSVSKLGYYEIPKNLDFNTQNINFESLTLGQLRNHLATMAVNSNQVVGSVPGVSNIRDLSYKSQSGSILQHASPVIYSELFLVDGQMNFMKGVELARHEYSVIKNKILELSLSVTDTSNIPALLDTLLKKINSVKNKTFPWYYSDMVPYGDIKNTITYKVLNTELRDFEISSLFSDLTLSNTATLVYVNNQQLIKGQDYVFDTTRAGITINASYQLGVGDIVTIYEYSNTDGNFIPETPTKLGLYPKFTPGIYFDRTYQNPINVIQGHDGSITPAFGDYRDDLMLEFEKRIYNNIKIDYTRGVLDLSNFVPGKFRNLAYTNNEFSQLLTKSFLRWVGSNRVDFTNNSSFAASNPFTWNYSKFTDTINQEPLLGNWRAIYKYFYDTDRPHTNPWEMLGFSEKPSWWEGRYGPAPYTGGNLVLWEDLQAGFIFAGSRAGTDPRFARPGLLQIIPVNEFGNLRAPNEFLVTSFNSNDANGSFSVGDQGPVETAWRRSSDFPYAMQQALATGYPAFYFGSLFSVNDYYRNEALGQYVSREYTRRRTYDDVDVNGCQDLDDPLKNGSYEIARSAGYINWIAEYLRSQGIDPGTKLSDGIANAKVQLAYKMAGYSDKTFLNVLAEQSSPTSTNLGIVIPNENYSVDLYKSTPTKTIVYSAVIVEKSDNGYTVSGYDSTNPFFTIIPSLANNNAYGITVLDDVGVVYQDYQQYMMTVPYGFEFNNKQQVVDFLVSYERYLVASGIVFGEFDADLQVQRDFKLSVREFLLWSQQGWAPGNIIVLSPIFDKLVVNTPIGVIDEVTNDVTGSKILDVNFNFIKSNQFSVTRTDNNFSIRALNTQTIGLAILYVVEYEHVLVFDNKTVFNDIIYIPELGNRQYRLKLVGSKTGSWTGNLNPPGFIFNSSKVDSWEQGTDYAKGSLVSYKASYYSALADVDATQVFNPAQWTQIPTSRIKTGLLPNFSYNAEKFKRFNDIDSPELQGDFDRFSLSTIGFRKRQYLSDFGLDEITQAKFYQGFIKEKGSINAITAFTAAGFNGVSSNISLYEEWGMRVGEYGALTNNEYAEVILPEGQFTSDPITFTLIANTGVTTDQVTGIKTSQLYKYSPNYTPAIYPNRDQTSIYNHDAPVAGYVNLNDIDTTIFDLANYNALNNVLPSLNVGYKIWCAKDFTGDWNVYRVTETDISVTRVAYNVDSIGTVTVSSPHTLKYGDLVVIRGFDARVDSIYQVYGVVDTFKFTIILPPQVAAQMQTAKTINGTGPLYTLESLRIKKATNINTIAPPQDWVSGDKLWVDNDSGSGYWSVYNKSNPWTSNVNMFNPSMKLNANSYVTNSGFGSTVTISPLGTFAAAGIPGVFGGNGNVIAFVANITNGNVLTLVSNLGSPSGNASGFGKSLSTAGNVLYVGAPGDGTSQQGATHIYKFNGNATFAYSQTLNSPSTSNIGDLFGTSIATSADGAWLFVGAPSAGNVYVYHANATSFYTYANTIVGNATSKFGYVVQTTSDASQTIISAPYETTTATSAGAVYVYDRSIETFVAPGTATITTQYPVTASTVRVTVNGNVTTAYTTGASSITFTSAPVAGSLINVETSKFQFAERLASDVPISGGNFGLTTDISGNDAEIFVSSPGYSEPGYHSGIIYRYVNSGAAYGRITGTIFNPTVTSGDSMRINGFAVTFGPNVVAGSFGNITSIAANITSANIPGVSVTTTNGFLTILSNVATPYQKLIIGPGPGNVLANIGLGVYANVQVMRHPGLDDVAQFGSTLMASDNSASLIVGATGGTTYASTVIDGGNTTVDTSSTEFLDGSTSSGVVYVYGLVGASLTNTAADQYVLVQKLENSTVTTNDQFGASLAYNGSTLLIGAPGDSKNVTTDPTSGLVVNIPSAGTFYTYKNISGNVGWDITRSQTAKVDVGSISRMYIYDSSTTTILNNLDHVDPAKGKILGIAEENLDFKTTYDPAIYNAAGILSLSINLDCPWGEEHVGHTWWNLDLVKYIDYEQSSISYRVSHWGATFPGSQIQVNEWIESDSPPSQYTGDGTPLYANDEACCFKSYVDLATKMLRSKYYFWVTGKTSVDSNKTGRTMTASTIQDVIQNPQAQGIPYAAVAREDTMSLYNITNKLSGNTTVFHVEYDGLKNTNVIHSEFQLVQEGNANSQIPTRIIEKIKDSYAGEDALGNPVPDPSLSPQTATGLGQSPNQSLFVNRVGALSDFVEYVNSVLISQPIVEEYNINGLYAAEPYPSSYSYDITATSYLQLSYVDTALISAGYTVLVINDETQKGLWATYSYNGTSFVLTRTQSYYTPFYWALEDWYDSSYDSTVKPTYVVDTYSGLAALTPSLNNTAYVTNRGNGLFSVYRYDGATWQVVGLQNGTIQFSNLTSAPGNVIRNIFETLQNYIFIDNLKSKFNELFFYAINYILVEQPSVDWVFKTSFISILHQLRKLQQFPNYIQDNQTYYESYINEVKPYRTSIREYLLDYQGSDEYYGDITDFDLPSTYNSNIGAYRSPNGAISSDVYELTNNPAYRMWATNYTYGIERVLVDAPGFGYVLPPNVTVVGGGGTGAVIAAELGYTAVPSTVLNLSANAGVFIGNIIYQANGGAMGTVGLTSIGNTITLVTSTITGVFGTGANTYVSCGNANIALAGNLAATVNSLTYGKVNVSGGIVKFDVVKPGTGFTSTPLIFVNGTGSGAIGHAVLTGNYFIEKVPAQDLVVPANVTVYSGNIITQPNTGASGIVSNYSFTTTTVLNLVSNANVYIGNVIVQANGGASGNVAFTSNGNVVTLLASTVIGTFVTGANTYIFSSNANLAANVSTITSGTTANTITLTSVDGAFSTVDYIFSDAANLSVNPSTINSYIEYIDQSYNLVRSFNSEIKFDRVSYTSNVVTWKPNITVTANSIVSYQGQAYLALSNVYSSAIITLSSNVTATAGNYITQANATGNSTLTTSVTNSNVIIVSNVTGNYNIRWGNIASNGTSQANTVPVIITNVFDKTKYRLLDAGSFTTAGDRIMAYYQPTAQQPTKDLDKLMSGISYPGVKVQGQHYKDSAAYLDTIFAAAYGSVTANIQLNGNITGNLFGGTVAQLGSSGTAKVISLLTGTRNYVTVSNVAGTFTPNVGNLVISAVDMKVTPRSLLTIANTQAALGGINPLEIVVDGGKYFDTYSSHAPEELIPGVTYDSLYMTVYTGLQNNTQTVAYSITQNMQSNAYIVTGNVNYLAWPQYYKVSFSNVTTLASNLSITDSNIYVTNANVLMPPVPALGIPGVIYINGEKILFYSIDYTNNVLGQIRRAVDGTGAPAIHRAGKQVVEVGPNQLIPGGNIVHWTTWLNTGSSTFQQLDDNFGNIIVSNASPYTGANIELDTQGLASGQIFDGTGLEGSSSAQAVFIKGHA